MIRMCFLFLSLIIFISCRNKNDIPSGILKPEKMQVVLWDVIKADAFTTEFIKKDSTKNAVLENLKLQKQIFAIHHISKEEFYKSYDYYKLNSVKLKIILDSMLVTAERDRYKSFKMDTLKAE